MTSLVPSDKVVIPVNLLGVELRMRLETRRHTQLQESEHALDIGETRLWFLPHAPLTSSSDPLSTHHQSSHFGYVDRSSYPFRTHIHRIVD